MSDEPYMPSHPVALMSALKARDIARAHQGWASYLRSQSLDNEATTAERQAQSWYLYAQTLAHIPPGRIDD